MTVKSVAVVGVGTMGGPMAHRLRSAGLALTVCDRSEEALTVFRAPGVTITDSPADCGRADLVLVLVATPAQVRDVVLGESGIAAGLRPARPTIVAVMSTVGPDLVRDLDRELRTRGARLLDAPISGGQHRAEQGRLTILVGGGPADVESARPVLSSLGTDVFHCGPVGTAQTIKIVNNMIAVANAFVSAEAYRLALAHGVSLADAMPVVEASSGRNFLSADAGEAAACYAAWTDTRHSYRSLTSIMRKDLGLALELAAASQVTCPVTTSLAAALDRLGEDTFDSWRTVGGARASTEPRRG